ncbi:thiol-disulfide oxidoreductase ResA [Paenibacillus cisolokensis]|uniref:Thiol-disulfide oxidoreductase ResA n=1 Tax=Paenibacillus cisolokensis TaxID=1658519 RepID=A0ABQ4NDE7_9BACL|nr:redoxin domain-containing protein [Paenibacillus cisolokensis]GIQ65959.1 thiol-disulfide oxidoreductase ResA [Paenibacillus cisolokensis]
MTIRKSIQYVIVLALVAGGIYALTQHDAAPRDKAVLGEAAPLFTLRDLYGEEIQLADYRGKGVLLNFWASWCNPCVNELPLLNEAYKLTGVKMLAINVGENAETVQKFVDRYELKFPVVLDSEMRIKQQYRVVGMPLTVLINAEGDLIERHEGELTEMADILNLMGRINHE